MFDLENDLPDELMASSSWTTTTDSSNIHSNETPGTGPGPGSGPGPGGPLIGAQDTNSNAALHRHVSHQLMHQVSTLCFVVSFRMSLCENYYPEFREFFYCDVKKF